MKPQSLPWWIVINQTVPPGSQASTRHQSPHFLSLLIGRINFLAANLPEVPVSIVCMEQVVVFFPNTNWVPILLCYRWGNWDRRQKDMIAQSYVASWWVKPCSTTPNLHSKHCAILWLWRNTLFPIGSWASVSDVLEYYRRRELTWLLLGRSTCLTIGVASMLHPLQRAPLLAMQCITHPTLCPTLTNRKDDELCVDVCLHRRNHLLIIPIKLGK